MNFDGLKVYVKSYGCQMNVYDSEKMSDMLVAKGCSIVDGYENADIVILNTCCIREKAEDKLFSDLGRIRPYKERAEALGKKYIIAVTGCISQIRRENIAKKSGCVDIILGPQMVQHIVSEIENCLNGKNSIKALTDFNSEEKFKLFNSQRISRGVSAFVTIQEGCNNFCTYCIVPHTRGREISRPVDDILQEIISLTNGGVKEITLLGQNVNSYNGVDSSGNACNLSQLLRKIAQISGVKRLRYTTSHPKDITDDLLEAYKDLDILMPFLHLPVQSGSDKILTDMNRCYSSYDYLKCIEKLRNARPDIAFSSDFIVGFPGETDEDFEQTISLVEEVMYAQAYSFKYSPRPNTRAAIMENQIPEEIKEERLAILQNLLNAQQKQYNDQFVGLETTVLLEKEGKHDQQLVGKTPYYQAVSMHNMNAEYAIGDIVKVKIIDSLSHSLSGEIIDVL